MKFSCSVNAIDNALDDSNHLLVTLKSKISE